MALFGSKCLSKVHTHAGVVVVVEVVVVVVVVVVVFFVNDVNCVVLYLFLSQSNFIRQVHFSRWRSKM